MNTKLLLILIAFLFVQLNSFADGYSDKIINSPNIYFQYTGNSTIDSFVEDAFKNYWKVNHFVGIPANADKKDIVIQGGKAPIFQFINSDEFDNTPGYADCLIIVWGNANAFGRKHESTNNTIEIMRGSLQVPSPKMNLLDVDYMIPIVIKEMNDKLMLYKMNQKFNDNPSALKEKTLLIPQEITVDMYRQKKSLPIETLTAYKYKYKILPADEIKSIANDPEQNSQYCYLASAGGPINIYDLGTKALIIAYTVTNRITLVTKQTDIEKISDEIATAPTLRKKK